MNLKSTTHNILPTVKTHHWRPCGSKNLYYMQWVQETCLLIQATLLRTASRFFHKGLHECFDKDYEHIFHSPQHPGVEIIAPDTSPIYMPAAG